MVSDKHLATKKSKLPKAGQGLFTKVFIKKGTRIVEYKGKVQSWKEVKAEDGYNGYLMYITRNTVINALPAVKTKGRYANDARGLSRKKGLTNNAEYVSEGARCFIEATRDIKPREEILVGYGSEYWTLIRKIKRQAKGSSAKSGKKE